jgi:hypothetical protein
MADPLLAEADLEPLLPEAVRTMRVLALALCGGPLFLAGAAAVLAQQNAGQTDGDATLLPVLTVAHAVFAAAAWAAGWLIEGATYKRVREGFAALGSVRGNPMAGVLQAMRSAELLKLATREAAAMFGLVVCLLAALGGTLQANRWVLLNGLSTLAFWGYALGNLPSAERYKELLRTKILGL